MNEPLLFTKSINQAIDISINQPINRYIKQRLINESIHPIQKNPNSTTPQQHHQTHQSGPRRPKMSAAALKQQANKKKRQVRVFVRGEGMGCDGGERGVFGIE